MPAKTFSPPEGERTMRGIVRKKGLMPANGPVGTGKGILFAKRVQGIYRR